MEGSSRQENTDIRYRDRDRGKADTCLTTNAGELEMLRPPNVALLAATLSSGPSRVIKSFGSIFRTASLLQSLLCIQPFRKPYCPLKPTLVKTENLRARHRELGALNEPDLRNCVKAGLQSPSTLLLVKEELRDHQIIYGLSHKDSVLQAVQ